MMWVAAYKGRISDNPKARAGDRLICWWAGEPHSHVEYVIERVGDLALCVSASMRTDGTHPRGVRIKWININTPSWDVVAAPHHWPQPDALEWAHVHEAAGYDHVGFLRLGLRIKRLLKPLSWLVPKLGSRWFCSEVVALLADLPGNPANYTPTQVYEACKRGGA